MQHKKWLQQGIGPMKIAVNLSTQQFLKPNLVSYIKQTLYETGMGPECLVLEITEYMAMEYHHSLKVMHRLKELGVCISIDDFGTGYSSLKYLKDFPIDYLKIDKSFVQEIIEDDNDAAIVTAIVSLAHTLKLEVIAEGVETKEQLDYLQHCRCEKSQGYLFSKPLPVNQFEQRYDSLIQHARAILLERNYNL
jgi:EAL domain-containing protein (putative c-di-GMP-specific phosphodiesterase class I)